MDRKIKYITGFMAAMCTVVGFFYTPYCVYAVLFIIMTLLMGNKKDSLQNI